MHTNTLRAVKKVKSADKKSSSLRVHFLNFGHCSVSLTLYLLQKLQLDASHKKHHIIQLQQLEVLNGKMTVGVVQSTCKTIKSTVQPQSDTTLHQYDKGLELVKSNSLFFFSSSKNIYYNLYLLNSLYLHRIPAMFRYGNP